MNNNENFNPKTWERIGKIFRDVIIGSIVAKKIKDYLNSGKKHD